MLRLLLHVKEINLEHKAFQATPKDAVKISEYSAKMTLTVSGRKHNIKSQDTKFSLVLVFQLDI